MRRTILMFIIAVSLTNAALAQSNIDAGNKFAFAENIGWTNWRDAGSPTAAQGVRVLDTIAVGFVWSENTGWINLGNGSPANGLYYANATGADFGVNIAPYGTLHGLAWGENIGWINFDGGGSANPPQPAFVQCDGRLGGVVWGENIGWINLSMVEAGKHVALLPAASPHTCDMNRDGSVDGQDVQSFASLLMLGGATWRDLCAGDLPPSDNGMIDAADVNTFVACLLSAP